MLNFDFSEKGLGIVSPPYFVYDFLRNMFLMLYSNWRNFIVWMPLILDILGNMCFPIVCFPGCGVYILILALSFKPSNLILFIKPFFYMTKKSRPKLKYLDMKKSFLTIFKGISVAKKLHQTQECALSQSFDCWNFCSFGIQPDEMDILVTGDKILYGKRVFLQKNKNTNLFSSTMLRYFVIASYQFVKSLQIVKNNNLMGVGEGESEEFQGLYESWAPIS